MKNRIALKVWNSTWQIVLTYYEVSWFSFVREREIILYQVTYTPSDVDAFLHIYDKALILAEKHEVTLGLSGTADSFLARIVHKNIRRYEQYETMY